MILSPKKRAEKIYKAITGKDWQDSIIGREVIIFIAAQIREAEKEAINDVRKCAASSTDLYALGLKDGRKSAFLEAAKFVESNYGTVEPEVKAHRRWISEQILALIDRKEKK